MNVNPDAVTKQGLTLWQVAEAVNAGNAVAPSGTLKVGDQQFLVTHNVMVGAKPAEELAKIPVKLGEHPVLLGDVATIADSSDLTVGYSLVNGRRSVYLLVTKRADASTVSVVNEVKAALPKMREAVPEDIDIDLVFRPVAHRDRSDVGRRHRRADRRAPHRPDGARFPARLAHRSSSSC